MTPAFLFLGMLVGCASVFVDVVLRHGFSWRLVRGDFKVSMIFLTFFTSSIEELIYRAILYLYFPYMPLFLTISTVTFLLLHYKQLRINCAQGLVELGKFNIILCLLYLGTGSIVACIAAHATRNVLIDSTELISTKSAALQTARR